MPFGELLVDEHLNSYNSPFKFNEGQAYIKQPVAVFSEGAKWRAGMDDETGNYYYGARYYNPKTSIWLSVDLLADKYPGWSPYNYTMNNPINMIDPTGMAPDRIFNVTMEDGSVVQQEIDDGVDEVVDIQEQDFNQLQALYNNAPQQTDDAGNTTKDLSSYNTHYDRLGLRTVGYDIAVTARSYEGSLDWDYNAKKGNLPAGSYKCNKFVQDVLSENGAAPPGKWPPIAGTWANKNAKISGWSVVTDAHLGDVVAGAYYTDSSGHVVIVTGIDPNTGNVSSMETVHSNYIGDNGYGNNLINNGGNHDGKTYTPIAIRRYTGN